MAGNCAQCDGTGWRPVEIDGVRCVERCPHGAASVPAKPMVVFVDALGRARLDESEKAILDLILDRRGRANAIRIREIIDLVWPQAGQVARTLQEEQNCQRAVKAAVEKFRDELRIPVVAGKGRDAGYFIPAEQCELQDYHDRLMREGWKLIEMSQLFVRDVKLAEMLAAKAGRL